MRASFIREQMAVFEPEGVNTFSLDAVQLTVFPRSLPPGTKPPLGPLAHMIEALPALGTLKKLDCLRVEMEHVGLKQLLALGTYGGTDRCISSIVKASVSRRLRARLTAAEYSEVSTGPGARDDNYVDPAYLAPGIDLHAEALCELLALASDARKHYIAAVAAVFGFKLDPIHVGVTVAQVELTWDRVCQLAAAVPTMMWPAWRDAFYGANRSVREVEATEHRETYAAAGVRVLRADGVKGDGAKLYAKHNHLLRFEAELTGPRASEVLGHAVQLGSIEQLRSDLEPLAIEPYQRLLRAQANLTASMPVVGDVVNAFFECGVPRKVKPILDRLLAGGHFHHEREEHYDELRRMKARGLVYHLARGYWAPTPAVARAFAFIQWRERRAVPDGEAAR